MRYALPLMLAVLVLAGCGEEKAAPGDVTQSFEAISEGTRATVQVPSGALALTVGEPIEELDEDAVSAAPRRVDGGSYVGVGWEFDARASAGPGLAVSILPLAARLHPPEVTLVADGRRYPVGAPYRVVMNGGGMQDTSGGQQYVAVEGDPQELSVEVAYDGLTQTVSLPDGEVDAGPARGLVGFTLDRERTCEPAPEEDLQGLTHVPVDCEVHASVRLPYAATRGWAEAGREWAVVDVSSVMIAEPEWRDVDYRATKTSTTFTVDGAEPADNLAGGDTIESTTGDSGIYVFDVPAGEPATLRVTQEFDVAPEDAGGPDVRRLVVERTVEI